jgi:hypothetical protein
MRCGNVGDVWGMTAVNSTLGVSLHSSAVSLRYVILFVSFLNALLYRNPSQTQASYFVRGRKTLHLVSPWVLLLCKLSYLLRFQALTGMHDLENDSYCLPN